MAVLQSNTDIVFLVDTSGSMSSKITRVKNSISNFADSLSNENVSFRLGLVDFGYYGNTASNTYIKNHGFFEDVETFKSELSALYDSGGAEYGLTAIQTALDMDFREGVTKRFIMLTDEGYYENGESGTDYSYSDLESDTVISLLNNNGVVLDVVGAMDGSYSTYYHSCQNEYEPIANATGGKFYDIELYDKESQDYTETFEEIVKGIVIQNTGGINVNLNDVGESETGVFIVNEVTNSDGTISITNVATFKVAAEEGDIVVGNVTAENIYVAESETEYNQNITIPENWNVTATAQNDYLNITGNNATVAGGEGADHFVVASGVNDVVFADFTSAEDSLSFGIYMTPGTLNQSLVEETLALSSEEIEDFNVTFKNTTSLINSADELYNKSVNNGSEKNTIGELIDGISNIPTPIYQTVNPEAPVMMSLSHWSYGFYPSGE